MFQFPCAEASPVIRIGGQFSPGAREQSVELETGRIGRASASNISLLIDGQPIAGKGNVRVPFELVRLLMQTKIICRSVVLGGVPIIHWYSASVRRISERYGQIYDCATQGVKYGISKCFSIALSF